jgi:tRNA U54 and U55 pseudouridine synthase Pus10
MTDTSDQKVDSSTPQEVTSVRAKSTRHRKVTADKWNQ